MGRRRPELPTDPAALAAAIAEMKAELARRPPSPARLARAERDRRHRRKSLLAFVEQGHGAYRAGWVHRRLCRVLERFSAAVARGESPRLIISMPPRAGKSEIVSKRYPVWHLGHNPTHEVVCASYAQSLASKNSRAARRVARGQAALEVFPELALPPSPATEPVDTIDLWEVGRGGTYQAVGVGGPLTGSGAHVLVIDDPHKNREEADSETMREKAWDWYVSTAYTRLAPGGGVIVMATRWHEDDLIGRLLAASASGDGDKWEVIALPAIADDDEPVADEDLELAAACEGLPTDSAGRPCWRLAGEALHPDRYPLARLQAIRAAIGVREWEALYQGRPVPRSGNLIRREWFAERYACRPEDIAATADEVWVSADAAKKGTSGSDFHAIHVWAKKGPRRYLLDRLAERMGYPEFEQALDGKIARWAPFVARAGGVLVEDTANGTTYLQVRGPMYLGCALIDFRPQRDTPGTDKSKGARAVFLERPAAALAIVLPESGACPWAEDVIAWWCAFPRGKHDDDVDAASQINMRWTIAEAAPGSMFDLFAGLFE